VPERGRQLMPHQSHFTPRKKSQYSLNRRVGVTPRPVWICMENLAPPGLTPDCSVSGKSLSLTPNTSKI
jgi:hypothetical protein